MLTTVEGVFREGRIELREAPPDVEGARVIVTFLPESPESGADLSRSASEANRRMLALLQAWQAEPLTAEEERLLDDFDAFQAQHPLRFTRLAPQDGGAASEMKSPPRRLAASFRRMGAPNLR